MMGMDDKKIRRNIRNLYSDARRDGSPLILEKIDEIKHGKVVSLFRGITPEQYTKWIPVIGHKDKRPSLLKTFRFSQEDILILNSLSKRWRLSQIETLRKLFRNSDPETKK
jgi:hypothetical protein